MPVVGSAGPLSPCLDEGEDEETEEPSPFSACNTPVCGSPGVGCGPLNRYELISNPQLNCGFNPWGGSCANWNSTTWCRKIIYYGEGCSEPPTGSEVLSTNKGCG